MTVHGRAMRDLKYKDGVRHHFSTQGAPRGPTHNNDNVKVNRG
jgi:hypothetical protein